MLETIHTSKDPTTFSVLLEDSAALSGLLFAYLGIFLGRRWDLPQLDGVASVLIGLLLCGVALRIVYESKGLLIVEGVDRATLRQVRAIVASDPAAFGLLVVRPAAFGVSDAIRRVDAERHQLLRRAGATDRPRWRWCPKTGLRRCGRHRRPQPRSSPCERPTRRRR